MAKFERDGWLSLDEWVAKSSVMGGKSERDGWLSPRSTGG